MFVGFATYGCCAGPLGRPVDFRSVFRVHILTVVRLSIFQLMVKFSGVSHKSKELLMMKSQKVIPFYCLLC